MRLYRLSVSMLVLVALIILAPAALAAGPYTEAALGALSWTASQQQADGSFAGFGAGSTNDAVLAICAAGGDPNGFLVEGNSPLTYLAANVDTLVDTTGNTAKTILSVVCADKDPRNFAGVDLIAALEKTQDAGSGQYGSDLTGHTFAMLALAATGRPIPASALAWLRGAQTPEGGWGWSGSSTSGSADTNSTALALQALAAAGVSAGDAAVQSAIAYLHTQQNDDGGFPYANPSDWGTDTDANSTAYVIQGLLAAGEDPEGSAWKPTGHSPLDALLSLQTASGGIQWQAAIPGENALASYQAVPALMLKTFPLDTMTAGPAVLPDTGSATLLPLLLGGAGTVALGLGLGLALRRTRSR